MSTFGLTDTMDREAWDQFVCNHAKGSIFHTPEIFDVFSRTRHNKPVMLAATGSRGDILALLLAVSVQTLPNPFSALSSRSIFYAEPLCQDNEEGEAALAALLAAHDSRVRNHVLFTEVRPLCSAGRERRVLERAGYVYEDYLNYLLDLKRPAEELWKHLTPESRRRINNNAKKGLTIREMTTQEGVDILYRFLTLTYGRARVPLADKSLFTQAVRTLTPRDQVRISTAYYEGEPVGATIALLYQQRFFAWYAGADRIHSLYPMEYMAWREIEWAKEHGFAVYDFGGAGWPNKAYGVRDFKAKFGGELVQFGRYRKIYSPWKFAAAEKPTILSGA